MISATLLYFWMVMFATNSGLASTIIEENVDQPKNNALRTNHGVVVDVVGYLDMPTLNHTYLVGDYSTQPRPVQYVIVMDKVNWYDAVFYCKARQMDLAIVRSETDHQLMIKLMNQSGIPQVEGTYGVWLGGTNLESDHGFYWITDGVSFSNSYSNWGPGQPSGGQQCLHYWYRNSTWQWDDMWCSNGVEHDGYVDSPFACEYLL
uniref:Perlucin-like protein n=1 Tax=Lygus hesperus TaxID=30085 RepID=A0A0A9WAB6_LYGHE